MALGSAQYSTLMQIQQQAMGQKTTGAIGSITLDNTASFVVSDCGDHNQLYWGTNSQPYYGATAVFQPSIMKVENLKAEIKGDRLCLCSRHLW